MVNPDPVRPAGGFTMTGGDFHVFFSINLFKIWTFLVHVSWAEVGTNTVPMF